MVEHKDMMERTMRIMMMMMMKFNGGSLVSLVRDTVLWPTF